ncbi:hypothetical protein SECTIM467_164 [Brevibacillus phage SecTim467]|uniref:Uncharacterized protein n=2 Tax=Jenstvirus jenst TaxID=1982225 RepID=A0A0K2CNT5_9CAUD|nr:hypothetical protein AVV11_gp032 [Brevibacillus phage Jenst]ALA07288.1 hypothetical protein JENST_159 [Brevibacillus phage Jenst]ALA07487.1 hypothetical protein SECTIM467_164 [Brevibacillus phage SecTim467]
MANKLWANGKAVIPKYIRDIAENVRCTGLYTYKLVGVNRYRPNYGIYDDFEKLSIWAERNGAEVIVKEVSDVKFDYYIVFEMTDPVVQALESEGFCN